MPTDELVGALRECSLHTLLILSSKVLATLGYGDIEIQGRRESGQKSLNGGHEIVCNAILGTSRVMVLVKVSVDRTGIRTRMLDELAGTTLRVGADHGILLTPFHVSPKIGARQAAYSPVKLEAWDGEGIASLMRRSGVGVRPDGSPDWAYLQALEDFGPKVAEFARKGAL